jgi:hypothetical protein
MSHASSVRGASPRDGPGLVARPSGSGRSLGQAGGAVAWILASLLYSLRFDGLTRVVVVGVGVAVAVGVVGFLYLARRRMKLALVGRRLVFSGLMHDRVVLDGDHAGRVVDVEVAWGGASRRRSRLWLLVTAAGRVAVGLNRATWDGEQLENIRQSLGLPLEVIDTPKCPADVRTAYPGSVPWWAVRPVVAALVVIVAVAVLVLAGQALAK